MSGFTFELRVKKTGKHLDFISVMDPKNIHLAIAELLVRDRTLNCMVPDFDRETFQCPVDANKDHDFPFTWHLTNGNGVPVELPAEAPKTAKKVNVIVKRAAKPQEAKAKPQTARKAKAQVPEAAPVAVEAPKKPRTRKAKPQEAATA